MKRDIMTVRSTRSAWADYLLWAISYCNLGPGLGSPPWHYGPPPKMPPFPMARGWEGPWGFAPYGDRAPMPGGVL
jgi:hypothetical protein